MTDPSGRALRFASALSIQSDSAAAVTEVCAQTQASLGANPDLAVVFVSPHHGPDFEPIAQQVSQQTQAKCVIGCTGESIVGSAREIEGQPAVSLWVASLPGVHLHPMHLTFEETPEGATWLGWPDDLPDPWPEGSALVLLGEPFSFPADALLARVNEEHPGVSVVGGMASGAWSPGENRLFLNGRELDSGAVAVLVHGPVRVRAIVSQGCRPIGRPYVVTKAQQNVIIELGGKRALDRLGEVFQTLDERDQKLLQSGLHLGRVIDEYREKFDRGDFLVRNVIGVDPNTGALAIGDVVRPGQTVQFHLRDADTADEDLQHLLAGARQAGSASAALLFTCNGRGTRLFPQPNHDALALQENLGNIPVAGFFAQGELGPIGGKNFIHGFTASVVLFDASNP